jgi:hypothetical protein
MNSKERLLCVLRHEIPDRIPISLYEMVGFNSRATCPRKFPDAMSEYQHDHIDYNYLTGWHNEEPSYQAIMEKIRRDTDCISMTDVSMSNPYLAEHTCYRQWREGESVLTSITLDTPKGELTRLYRVDDSIKTAWQIEHAIKTPEDIEKYLSIPDGDLTPVDLSNVNRKRDDLGDKGIIMIDIPDPVAIIFDLFEFGDFVVTAYTEKDLFLRLLDKVFEQQMFYLKDILKKGGGPLFRIVGPEVATPPYLYEEHFLDYVYRYDARMIRLIHEYGQFARIHCHGKIRSVLPYFLKMEADAIDPAEAPPSGDIRLDEIKEVCGKHLTIMGNIQLKDIEYASPEEMEKLVLQCIRQGKRDGCFVIMPTATPINIPLSPVSERNIAIMIDTALKHGVY